MKKVTRTFGRSDTTMTKYMETTRQRELQGVEFDPFLDWERTAVATFDHWVIVPNEFPYDRIATVNHMIATKRTVPFDWKLLTEEERKEFELLKETYLAQNYDVLWENLPKGQTLPLHFHLHLLVLKREEI